MILTAEEERRSNYFCPLLLLGDAKGSTLATENMACLPQDYRKTLTHVNAFQRIQEVQR